MGLPNWGALDFDILRPSPLLITAGYDTIRAIAFLSLEVHTIGDGKIDATLINQPFNVSSMKLGDRREHDLELLTDWTIITPAGPITPRGQAGARILRAHGDEIRKAKAEARNPPGGEA